MTVAAWWGARCLLRAARAGTLATQSGGQPSASLVTPATAPDGSVLMLLSGLSAHTKHLRDDPRCALLVQGAPAGPNPQTAPRLTVTGTASPEPDAGLKARWVALHPYAAFYADLGDFTLWRLRPEAGQFVGGFARAFRLAAEDLLPAEVAVAAVARAEAGILAHVNADHADALAVIAGQRGPGLQDWRIVAADVDGCDLASGERVLRLPWSAPVADAGGVRTELVRMARDARQAKHPTLDPDAPLP